VTHLAALLDAHVRTHDLGRVCVSPVDVVLDRQRALVVQPDIIFVASARLHLVTDRVWGPPDLIVEVLSPRTAARDRGTRVEWYRRYGVAEVWLVDVNRCSVEVVELRSTPEHRTLFIRNTPIQSGVLPHWNVTPAEVLS
jgi:Uma2 family endonuclease